MKYLLVSDIHGSLPALERVLQIFEHEHCDLLCLLGDILNYGPRNGLPEGLDPQGIVQRLKPYADRIVAVRGNCDSEVDQMVLDFPIMADYALLPFDFGNIYATHGHVHGKDAPPPLQRGDILLCGHTHVPDCTLEGCFLYINPGSVSLPKENSSHGYMLLDGGVFTWKTLQGVAWQSFKL